MLNDLTFATAPHRVYAAGAPVAQDGTFVGEIAPEMAEVAALADELRASVKLPKLSLDVFDYAFKPGEAVIDVVPGKAITGMVRPERRGPAPYYADRAPRPRRVAAGRGRRR